MGAYAGITVKNVDIVSCVQIIDRTLAIDFKSV
jgi:hypothetical protein